MKSMKRLFLLLVVVLIPMMSFSKLCMKKYDRKDINKTGYYLTCESKRIGKHKHKPYLIFRYFSDSSKEIIIHIPHYIDDDMTTFCAITIIGSKETKNLGRWPVFLSTTKGAIFLSKVNDFLNEIPKDVKYINIIAETRTTGEHNLKFDVSNYSQCTNDVAKALQKLK